MKLLVHVCCAPCFCFTDKRLKEEGHEVTGFFYNPNIHPAAEFSLRLEALRKYSELKGTPVVFRGEYSPLEIERWAKSAFSGEPRCAGCYDIRLREAAIYAKENKFDAFTTTLLYSIYQKHDLIRATCERIALEVGIPFFYEDFRPGWREGIAISKELGLYRQKYCGCFLSEAEALDGRKNHNETKR